MADDDLRVDSKEAAKEIPAPDLLYIPPMPADRSTPICLIGCGGVSAFHLQAYKDAGLNVVALCDTDQAKAEARRAEYFPKADVHFDYHDVLAYDDIAIADIAVHPEIRTPMIEAALESGKHVLSQKPFVIDLDEGERLCDLADERGLQLAVNQNGRWAPHLSYMREAIGAGLIGEVTAAHLAVHWDHTWTLGRPFDDIPHLVLYDFGIHWFDILGCLLPGRDPTRVYASTAKAAGQENRAPLLAHVGIEYDDAQASLSFDAATPFGGADTTYIAGTNGSVRSEGPDLNHQSVALYTEEGVARPALQGEWFTNGFLGTMTDLLCAIEEDRAPLNNARDNLRSLALCFAAMASADEGEPKVPGTVRRAG